MLMIDVEHDRKAVVFPARRERYAEADIFGEIDCSMIILDPVELTIAVCRRHRDNVLEDSLVLPSERFAAKLSQDGVPSNITQSQAEESASQARKPFAKK